MGEWCDRNGCGALCASQPFLHFFCLYNPLRIYVLLFLYARFLPSHFLLLATYTFRLTFPLATSLLFFIVWAELFCSPLLRARRMRGYFYYRYKARYACLTSKLFSVLYSLPFIPPSLLIHLACFHLPDLSLLDEIRCKGP